MQADENMVIDLLEREGNLYEHTLVVTKLCIIVAKNEAHCGADLQTCTGSIAA